jgi:hypothetical protein
MLIFWYDEQVGVVELELEFDNEVVGLLSSSSMS